MTNNYNIPAPVFNAIAKDDYKRDPSAFASVTQLCDDPFYVALSETAPAKEPDAIDFAAIALGKAWHDYIERANGNENALIEERLTIDIDGAKITGALDYYNGDTCQLLDYKVSTVWAYQFKDEPGSQYQKWVKQLNIYAYMLRANGFPVKSIAVSLYIKDWSGAKGKFDPNYPTSPIIEMPIQIFTDGIIEQRLRADIAKLKAARNGQGNQCSIINRWERPTVFKVMKGTNKKSSKNLPTYADAKEWADNNIKVKYDIVEHKGARVRCEGYCNYSDHCPGYQKHLKESK